ncbi:MAG: 23S rRNA (adenine(2030)-N(6))-methyltransferase RlmJ [Steroidobacteraceae bacterium]
MKYRHSFHAGNFADVHKHVTLLALISALQRKDKGFLYFETHAGRGLYDLGGTESQQGAEARHGIKALRAVPHASPEINAYLEAIVRAAGSGAQLYPGSPLLAAQALREQDRAVCCEILPPECRALERALHDYPRVRCLCADGYATLSAHLPPAERRALVLIDPPYEEPSAELERGLSAVMAILARLPNAIIALWYPIKDARDLAPWLARVATQLAAPGAHALAGNTPTLNAQLWLHPCDSRVALNGSGLLLINPPFQFDLQLQRWLPELAAALGIAFEVEGGSDARQHSGAALNWLVHEH